MEPNPTNFRADFAEEHFRDRHGEPWRVREYQLRYRLAYQVVDTKGEVLTKATEAEEFVGLIDVNPKDADDKQIAMQKSAFGAL